MNKLVLALSAFLILSLGSCSVMKPKFNDGRYCTAVMMGGYWSEWDKNPPTVLSKIEFYESGNTSYFILYNGYNHPSQYSIKVSYYLNSEKRDNNKWYVYKGEVEYYMDKSSESFPFRYWPAWTYTARNGKGYKKNSSAIVKIDRRAKDAYKGATFNIYFEDNAIGICGSPNY